MERKVLIALVAFALVVIGIAFAHDVLGSVVIGPAIAAGQSCPAV